MVETIVGVIVGIAVLAAFVVILLDIREVRFLRRLRPLIAEELPLLDGLTVWSIYVSAMGVYLLVMTAITTILGIPLTVLFPPLRAINAILFLGLLAGPMYLGREMRRKVNGHGPEQALASAAPDRKIEP